MLEMPSLLQMVCTSVAYLPMLTSTPRTRFAPTTGITDAPPSPPRRGEESGVDALLLPALLLNGDEALDIGGDA